MDRARTSAARCVPELGARARARAAVLRRRTPAGPGRDLGRQGLAMKASGRWSRWWAALRGRAQGVLAPPEPEREKSLASDSERPPSEAPHEALLETIRQVDVARPESRTRAVAALASAA